MPDNIPGKILITNEKILERVRELGEQISGDYEGREIVVVGILKGSFIFLSDLIRHIRVPLSVDFVEFSSYGNSTKSSGVVRIVKDLAESVDNKDVLIVEDIVDTGWTLRMSYITENLYNKKASSVKICTLLNKPDRRVADVNLDYVGFIIPNKYVFGYGLDLNGLYRNIPDIYSLEEADNTEKE